MRLSLLPIICGLGLAMVQPTAVRAQGNSQEAELLAVNVAFSGLTAGIGAMINRPERTDWKRQFLKGFWQGSLGGAVAYSGKRSLYFINRYNELGYALPARIIHFAGLSMIENAAQGRPLLESWHLRYGPVRLDYSTKSGSLRVRALPYSVAALYQGMQDGRLDVRTSLLTGVFAFRAVGDAIYYNGAAYNGFCYGNAFSYLDNPRYDKHEIISHELVHSFQFEDCAVFNTWLIPPARKFLPPRLARIAEKYVYADIPYFPPMYWWQDRVHSEYNGNYFEFEAARVSTGRFVMRR